MKTRDSSFSKLESFSRLFLAQLVLFFLLLINLVPLPVPVLGSLNPAFVLMGVYYWAVYRPTLLPPLLCFGAGLLMDILSGGPLGINALVFVAVQWIVRSQRRFLMGQPYLVMWFIFAPVALGAGLTQWFLAGLSVMRWSAPCPA